MHRAIHHCALLLVTAVATGRALAFQETTRVSIDSSGAEANGVSYFPSLSADGRFVTFWSSATNLVAGDGNLRDDVFVHDRATGTTERVSVSTSGGESDGMSRTWVGRAISADGSRIVFDSRADNLDPNDANAFLDVYVRDRLTGQTTLVSANGAGVAGNGDSADPMISADGNFVAYRSSSTNLVSGDTNGVDDIFVTGRLTGVTERVSLGNSGEQANSTCDYPCLSADGRFVAFESGADNLVGAHNDGNHFFDVFRRDRLNGVTVMISVSSSNAQGNGHSLFPSISADGESVAFSSDASNFVISDTNGATDVFVRTPATSSTRIVSLSSAQILGNGASGAPSISGDGRYVAFESVAANLVPGDTNGVQDVFLRDLLPGTTERVSLGSSGAEGDARSSWPSISGDGRFVAFESDATNLVAGDTNGLTDIFVRDRDTTGFTSVCHPGLEGVQLCPCSNQPSPADRGCDNSSGTGGALLSASGTAYLSMDSLVFTTWGETDGVQHRTAG
jgi:Tol biopolymer transport system component